MYRSYFSLLLALAAPWAHAAPTITQYCVDTDDHLQVVLALAAQAAALPGESFADIRLRASGTYTFGASIDAFEFEGISFRGNYEDAGCTTIDDAENTLITVIETPRLIYSADLTMKGLVLLHGDGQGLWLVPIGSGTTSIKNNRISTAIKVEPAFAEIANDVQLIGNVFEVPNDLPVETCLVRLLTLSNQGEEPKGSLSTSIVNNTFAGLNGDYSAAGICLSRLDEALVANNIIVDSEKPSVRDTHPQDPTLVKLASNLVEAPMDLVLTAPITASFSADPQFAAGAHGPFELSLGSPAINAGWNGVSNLLGNTDIAGNPRVVGSTPDIGAYESSINNLSNTITVTSTADSGSATLRDAILAANALDDTPQKIVFDLGPGPNDCGPAKAIQLTSALPDITDTLIIDGYSSGQAAPDTEAPGFDANLCVVLVDKSGDATSISNGLVVPANAPGQGVQLTVRGIQFGGFTNAGIALFGGTNHIVQGNAFLPWQGVGMGRGVLVAATVPNVLVGGFAAADRNHIGGTTSAGIAMLGSHGSIAGNLIGPGRSGFAEPGFGNAKGVTVNGNDNIVFRNTISGNSSDGVLVQGDDNRIRFNLIGYNEGEFCPGCMPTQGNLSGVRLVAGDNNKITGNRIGNQADRGIVVGPDATGNALTSNLLANNAGLGIDLRNNEAPDDPQTMDMLEDASTANGGQNFPLLLQASGAPKAAGPGVMATGSVFGQLSTRPGPGDYVVEVFANAECDESLHGEGEEVIGSNNVTVLDLPGPALDETVSFSVSVSSPDDLIGRHISATARAANGNTSELSACIQFTAMNSAPSFASLTLAIDRATPATTKIATLKAIDDGLPQPAELTYSLLTALVPFTVDTDGSLRVTQANIFEQSSVYNLDIKVDDGEKWTTGFVTIVQADLFHDGFE